jgi:hypothetical protein
MRTAITGSRPDPPATDLDVITNHTPKGGTT